MNTVELLGKAVKHRGSEMGHQYSEETRNEWFGPSHPETYHEDVV